MIDFQQEDRTQQRVIGAAATFAYAALVLLLLLLVRFTLAEPPDTGEGLMINFGNVTEAAPGEDLAMNDEAADAPQQTQAPSEAQPDEQEQMTQQTDEDVPVVKEEKKPEKKPKKEQLQAKPQPKPQQPAEKPREVNRKALFPGRTEGSSSRSEGTGTGTGNQGDLAGTPGRQSRGDRNGNGRQFGQSFGPFAGRRSAESRLPCEGSGTRRDRDRRRSAGTGYLGRLPGQGIHDAKQRARQRGAESREGRAVQCGRKRAVVADRYDHL